jgi:hypothetical protein
MKFKPSAALLALAALAHCATGDESGPRQETASDAGQTGNGTGGRSTASTGAAATANGGSNGTTQSGTGGSTGGPSDPAGAGGGVGQRGGDNQTGGNPGGVTGGSPGSGGKSAASGGSPGTGGKSGGKGGALPGSGGAQSTGSGGSAVPTDGGTASGWLHTEGNKILDSNGRRFHGRGANIFDTRQCGSCAWTTPHVNEVIRRVDELVDGWHANFMRFDLVSYASKNYNGMTLAQWGDVTQDASYLADLQTIIGHIGTKPGVYVMITLFSHPSQDENELPTSATMPVYKKLSETFKDSPHVLYGITNEPHDTTDASVLAAMNNAVDAIRSMEPASGPHHLIAVQGTQEYARQLGYYVDHPVTAGGGVNIVYETHVYNPQKDWQSMFLSAAGTLPVIIGEFGPDGTYMKLPDCESLMPKAEQLEIPYIGWSFSPECAPGMLAPVDNVTDCGEGMPLTPSDWGTALQQRLATAW